MFESATAHTTIAVTDIDRAKGFYSETLELRHRQGHSLQGDVERCQEPAQRTIRRTHLAGRICRGRPRSGGPGGGGRLSEPRDIVRLQDCEAQADLRQDPQDGCDWSWPHATFLQPRGR
jgi:catechol 2,3-dioxygenase-like lactoylglutathione lyase family enzyme